jgi:hypothetical protein
MIKTRENKNKKLRRFRKIIALLITAVMLASNFASLGAVVHLTPDIIEISITTVGNRHAGSSFEVVVTVKNITTDPDERELEDVTVTISNYTNRGVFELVTPDTRMQSIEESKTGIFSFIFQVSDHASVNAATTINFDISYIDGGTVPVTVTPLVVRTTAPPAIIPDPAPDPDPDPAPVITNVEIENISLSRSTVQSGDMITATVTVRNNNSFRVNNIQIKDEYILPLQSMSLSHLPVNLERAGTDGDTRTFTFNYKAGEVSSSMSGQIRFVVSAENMPPVHRTSQSVTINAVPEPLPPPTPYFDVTMTTAQSRRVAAGDTVRITLMVRPMHSDALNTSAAIISTHGGVTPMSPVSVNLGTVHAGMSRRVDFDLLIEREARTGYTQIDIQISSPNIENKTVAAGFIVERGESEQIPDIKIISAQLPETVGRGESFEIKAVVENTGGDAENVRATMSAPSGIVNTSPNIIQIGSLKQNERREIVFDVFATNSAAEFYNLIPITIDYTDSGGSDHKITQHVGFNVIGDSDEIRDFIIEANIPPAVRPGADFTVSVTVTNNGTNARNLLLKTLSQLTGVENRTNNIIMIPELKSGESITREITFHAEDSTAGRYCSFEIELTGSDLAVAVRQFAGTAVAELNRPRVIIDDIKIPQSVNVGDTFSVDVVFRNNGGAAAENIILTVNSPAGILNRTANTVRTDSLASGGVQTRTFTFFVSQNAEYGYNPFTVEVSDALGEKTNQFFGTAVNSSDLTITSVSVPGNIGINTDFIVDVSIRNTGADAANITLALAAQGGLINKTANTVRIDNIRSGETVTRSFTFMAPGSAPNGYAPIDITLTHGGDSVRQFSGIFVRNPQNDNNADERNDVPVVIINRFSYTSVEDDIPEIPEIPDNGHEFWGEPGMDFDGGFVFDFNDGGFGMTEREMFRDTSVVRESGRGVISGGEIIIGGSRPMPGMSDGMQGGTANAPNRTARDIDAVFGGKSFIFTLELLNTHRTAPVRDLKVTISQDKGIFNPKAGSNTFFVEWLNPGETTEIEIELLVKPDADPDSYGITVVMSYRNEKGDAGSATEIINIPVQQELRFGVGELPHIQDIELGDDAYITVQFGNLGNSLIRNVVVRVQGDGFMSMEAAHYAGNIQAGQPFSRHEFALTPFMAGFMNGMFIFTYEDADGNEYFDSVPFFFNVMGDDMLGDGGWNPWDGGGIEIDPETGLPVVNIGDGFESEESGGFWLFTDMNLLKWAVIGAGALVIFGGIGVTVVLIRRRIRKNNADDDDDDL